MKAEYQKFIESKIIETKDSGFIVDDKDLHPSNKPHQRDIIKWAAKGGQRAIFASFGLGKTQIQLELLRLAIGNKKFWDEGQFGLIICPLGVKGEFKKDAARLGMDIQYVKSDQEIHSRTTPFLITNYERVRDGGIDIKKHPTLLIVSLDEASVLRSYGSKTYQEFLPLFSNVPYRYVCTATPSPNKYKELIHYAGFLGIMDTGQALTRWFKRDSTKANNLTLHESKEREFWLWMASWSIFITKPSDLGHDDTGYDLPAINIHWHLVQTDAPEVITDDRGQLKAFKDVAIGLSDASREKRNSIPERLAIVKNIIDTDDPDKHWLIWHHLESERQIIEKEIKDVVTVYGSQDEKTKEDLLIGFSNGEYRILATKPSIAGQGCNFQYYCADAIFMGINYEFNDFIQALHRIHRFQQSRPVNIHILYTDAEENIKRELEAKWVRHDELVEKMTGIIQQYGLTQASSIGELKRSIGLHRQEVKGKLFTYVNNDNVDEYQLMESNSKGMILTSIPFSNHYEYTPSYNDFGHTNNDEHFFKQMDFLTPNLYRVLQPGRVACIHTKDRIMFGNVTGWGRPSVNPFHAKTLFHFQKHGFVFFGMITVETDVVRENNQTYRLGWTEKCKDGSKMGVGCPEYLLLFFKPQTDLSRGYSDVPVIKSKEQYTRGQWQIDARAKWNSSGDSLLNPDEIRRLGVDVIGKKFSKHFLDHIYNYHQHVASANALDQEGKLPATFEMLKVPSRTEYVWDDVVRMRTLNAKQTQAKEENHICPFQLDIVERAINLWTNEGDEVADPFGGIGSVGYEAIRLGRKAHLTELNSDYFHYGVGYCKEAEHKRSVPTLFDMDDLKKDIA
jgi:DNA modification methylase